MLFKVGHDGIALAFIVLEINVSNLDRATKVTPDEDITSDGD